MPIYEYECHSCGHIFDKLHLSSPGEKKVECPHCGKTDVQRRISLFSSRSGSGNSFSAPASGRFT